MILDLPTVVTLTALSALLMGVSILLSNHTQTIREAALQNLGYACLTQSVGWILIGLRGRIPDALSVFVGTWVLILSGLCYLRAVNVWVENRMQPRPKRAPRRLISGWVLAAVSGAGLAYFTFARPDLAGRTLVNALGHGYISAGCAHRLLAVRPIAASRRVVAIGFALVVISQAFQIGMLWLDPPRSSDIFSSLGAQTETLIFAHIAVVMLTFLFVLMVHDHTARDLRESASLDYLTGIFNRSAFEGYARQSIEQARRSGDDLSLLLFDVDNFKGINDTFGHLSGDVALRTLTALTTETLRSQDVFGRYGGEEFAVLLPATDAPGALLVAERLREAVAATEFRDEDATFRLTISIGIAQLSLGGPLSTERRLTALFRAADAALYDAKRAGRNRTLIAALETDLKLPFAPEENPDAPPRDSDPRDSGS